MTIFWISKPVTKTVLSYLIKGFPCVALIFVILVMNYISEKFTCYNRENKVSVWLIIFILWLVVCVVLLQNLTICSPSILSLSTVYPALVLKQIAIFTIRMVEKKMTKLGMQQYKQKPYCVLLFEILLYCNIWYHIG